MANKASPLKPIRRMMRPWIRMYLTYYRLLEGNKANEEERSGIRRLKSIVVTLAKGREAIPARVRADAMDANDASFVPLFSLRTTTSADAHQERSKRPAAEALRSDRMLALEAMVAHTLWQQSKLTWNDAPALAAMVRSLAACKDLVPVIRFSQAERHYQQLDTRHYEALEQFATERVLPLLNWYSSSFDVDFDHLLSPLRDKKIERTPQWVEILEKATTAGTFAVISEWLCLVVAGDKSATFRKASQLLRRELGTDKSFKPMSKGSAFRRLSLPTAAGEGSTFSMQLHAVLCQILEHRDERWGRALAEKDAIDALTIRIRKLDSVQFTGEKEMRENGKEGRVTYRTGLTVLHLYLACWIQVSEQVLGQFPVQTSLSRAGVQRRSEVGPALTDGSENITSEVSLSAEHVNSGAAVDPRWFASGGVAGSPVN